MPNIWEIMSIMCSLRPSLLCDHHFSILPIKPTKSLKFWDHLYFLETYKRGYSFCNITIYNWWLINGRRLVSGKYYKNHHPANVLDRASRRHLVSNTNLDQVTFYSTDRIFITTVSLAFEWTSISPWKHFNWVSYET